MLIFYDFFLALFQIGVSVVSFWQEKARLWKNGRNSSLEKIKSLSVHPNKNRIWIHCSSLGEFEQARPLMEAIRESYPQFFILLSFFSPSGYEIRKNYKGVDMVCYMPLDGRIRSKAFLDDVQPQLAIFIKYESWYHYLHELQSRNVPCYLVSAYFTPAQVFFKPWGGFFRKLLKAYSHIFVQDQGSFELLDAICLGKSCTVAGDTRFDQVVKTGSEQYENPLITKFCGQYPVLIAGSTWPEDEKIISLLPDHFPALRIIIAPHNINESSLQKTQSLFTSALLLSELQADEKTNEKKVLIIDNIGSLSKLYRMGTITYVGGGFNRAGIHNVLEPAVYSKPVIFGPNHLKSLEAGQLIQNGAGFSVKNEKELVEKVAHFIENRESLLRSGEKAGKYIINMKGATEKIMRYLSEHSLGLQ